MCTNVNTVLPVLSIVFPTDTKGRKRTWFSSNLSKVFPGSKRKSSDCCLKEHKIFPVKTGAWMYNAPYSGSIDSKNYGRNFNWQEKITHHSPWRAACTRRMLSGAYPEKTYEISLGLLSQYWTESETWHGTVDAGGVLRGKANYLAIDVNKPQAFPAGSTE